MHPDDGQRDFEHIRKRLGHQEADYLPSFITVHPTDACDHKCPWCWFSRSRLTIDMPRAIDTIDGLLNRGADEVVVSGGGEPLMHPYADDLLTYLSRQTHVHRRLYTHGGLLGRYMGLVNRAFNYVRISIDAGDPSVFASLHGVSGLMFSRILSSAGELVRSGVTVGMSMVVTEQNVDTIVPLVDACAERGIPYLFVKPAMDGLTRLPLPSMKVLEAVTNSEVKVCIRAAAGPATRVRLPDGVASLAVTLAADCGVYPCCHLTSDNWRVSSVGEPIDGTFISRFSKLAGKYGRTPHACRLHDGWLAWLNSRADATGRIVRALRSGVSSDLMALAETLASEIIGLGLHTVGITGPSSVGKTSFAKAVARSLIQRGTSCAVIEADDFLRSELRGTHSYREHANLPLTPDHYEFKKIVEVLGAGRRGESAAWTAYSRGDGWHRRREATAAAVYLVEGLFLDSTQASSVLDQDLVVVLDASMRSIAAWRRGRDARLRQVAGGRFRSPLDTEAEIVRTLAADAQYERERESPTRILVRIDEDHRVRSVET